MELEENIAESNYLLECILTIDSNGDMLGA